MNKEKTIELLNIVIDNLNICYHILQNTKYYCNDNQKFSTANEIDRISIYLEDLKRLLCKKYDDIQKEED